MGSVEKLIFKGNPENYLTAIVMMVA